MMPSFLFPFAFSANSHWLVGPYPPAPTIALRGGVEEILEFNNPGNCFLINKCVVTRAATFSHLFSENERERKGSPSGTDASVVGYADGQQVMYSYPVPHSHCFLLKSCQDRPRESECHLYRKHKYDSWERFHTARCISARVSVISKPLPFPPLSFSMLASPIVLYPEAWGDHEKAPRAVFVRGIPRGKNGREKAPGEKIPVVRYTVSLFEEGEGLGMRVQAPCVHASF